MIPEADAQQLIQRLERTTRRTRPLIGFGLIAILAGFATLAYYLDQQRRAALSLAAEQTTKVDDLNQTLQSAAGIVREHLQSPPRSPRKLEAASAENDQWTRLAALLKVATSQADVIGETVNAPGGSAPAAAGTQAPPPPVATAAVPAPHATTTAITPVAEVGSPKIVRLYLHITLEEQRPAAQLVAAGLAGQSIGNSTIVVPGVELVPNASTLNTVRCTKKVACARLSEVTDWLNHRLQAPKLRGMDLSGRYEKAAGIRPGTYEVWFGPGPIELAAPE